MSLPFLEQFDKYKASQKIALIHGSTSLTYAQLYERSLSLASRLRSLGVGMIPTSPEHYDIYNPEAARHSPWVVIITNRTTDAVIGVIAAWMAGGAFVLTEQSAPGEYISGIIEDTAAVAVIRDGELSVLEENVDFTCAIPQENDIACAVFTSGSTGRPKGAVLEHRVFNEMLKWQTNYMNTNDMTATAAYAPLGFIAAIWELFFPLYNGLTLHILDETTRHDMFALENYIEENRISYMFLPPNIAEIFTETYKGDALKYLRVAGGRLKACGNPAGRYEIMYHLGMSENGGSVTFKPIKTAMSGDIPIGKAWNNTNIRLEESTGEMIVSGPSLFRGYLARRDETEQKLSGGEYHSGDLVRIDDNGELVHMGRNDLVLKIRDMKVSPSQIEYAISECTGVFECCVTAQEDVLYGWFTGSTDEMPLRTELTARLPDYMIPARFVRLEEMPRNRNGKIDRSALVFTDTAKLPVSSNLSETETRIANMFERVLGLSDRSVNADDNFLRLGGDSLKLIRLQAEIARDFSQNIPYAALFENPTPQGIESLLRGMSIGDNQRIPSAPMLDEYPLSAPMRQMWLLWRTGQDRGKYTVSIRCRFNGEIDNERVISSFAELVRRNAILRSRFIMCGGEMLQIIEKDMGVSISKQARREFDLTKSPLFDITVTDNTLTFTTHHIVADATGLRVLMEDFWTVYRGDSPQESVQAHDITMWLIDGNSPVDESFWISMLSGKSSAFTLPYDRKRPDRLTSALRESITFDETEAGRLREYAANHNATVFQLFLSAYALLLSELGENPVIGVPFSGREHPDTARTIGMLVKTLPISVEVSGMSLDAALAHTRERFVSAWENQSISLERLMEIVDSPRTRARNPFYDVMINYVPLPSPLPDAEGLQPQVIRGGYPAALFDLILDVREETDGFSAVLTYADELFMPETIRRWLEALKKLLLTHELDIANVCTTPIAVGESMDSDEITPQISELTRIWEDVFGVDSVLPGDDFFAFGGTSLIAIRIEAALFEKGWFLSAADVLQNPKLYDMASLMTPAEAFDWEEET